MTQELPPLNREAFMGIEGRLPIIKTPVLIRAPALKPYR